MVGNKYWGFFLMEFKRAKFYLADILVRLLLISLRLLLPYSVFSVLAKQNQISWETAHAMLWAVLVGQIIYGSSLRLEKKIRDEIKSGEISIRMSEPVNYVIAKLFQSFGYFVPTYIIFTIIFFSGLSILAPTKLNLPVLLVFSILSFLIFNLSNIIVGLTSFIIEENDGVFYIVSKLFFIFGNQVLPVALMPAWAIGVAKFTPFYLGLAAPIEAASGRLNLAFGLGMSLFYILLMFWVSQFMLSSLRRRLIING